MLTLPRYLLLLVVISGCSRPSTPEAKSDNDIARGKEYVTAAHELHAVEASDANDYSKMTQVDPNLRKEAVAAFDKAVKDDPKNPDAYYARGFDILAHANNTNAAIEDFDMAIKLNPQFAKAYLMRSRAYAAAGDYTKAKADREKALELDPGID
ncbi:MAG: tetratricopeptide repeat protein [Planctomycetaceae bacterium]|nr:tetratricopeptide repeat protein [Planctomycetaceae bacterium]